MTREALGESISPALLKAQQRLLAMRAERVITPGAASKRAIGRGRVANGTTLDKVQANDFALLRRLPSHLGWGSARLTAQLRQVLARHDAAEEESKAEQDKSRAQLAIYGTPPFPAATNRPSAVAPATKEQVNDATIRLHPTLALGMLRAKLAAPGRVWLLLRWLDKPGQGWIASDRARQLLCDPASTLHLCSWRQLRSLLARGECTFWEQRDERIWLRSVPKVAQALNVRTFRGNSVDLPLGVLFAGIGAVRAHFYASFHSGRKVQNPISRAALANLSQVSPRSQQNYERRANVRKRRNYAIGPRLDSDQAEEVAWEHGSACFSWRDRGGMFSKQKSAHIAWQLPNSYVGPHKQRPAGRQRQFNRQLKVLSNKGMTGNEQEAEDMPQKRYFKDASRAVRFAGNRGDLVYWRDTMPGRWYCLAASSGSEA